MAVEIRCDNCNESLSEGDEILCQKCTRLYEADIATLKDEINELNKELTTIGRQLDTCQKYCPECRRLKEILSLCSSYHWFCIKSIYDLWFNMLPGLLT